MQHPPHTYGSPSKPGKDVENDPPSAGECEQAPLPNGPPQGCERWSTTGQKKPFNPFQRHSGRTLHLAIRDLTDTGKDCDICALMISVMISLETGQCWRDTTCSRSELSRGGKDYHWHTFWRLGRTKNVSVYTVERRRSDTVCLWGAALNTRK